MESMRQNDGILRQALSVGDVAKRTGVSVSTLHFYEERGLISSTRNSGNQRRFSRQVLRKVAIIKAAQKVGITLKEIEGMFAQLPNGNSITQSDWVRLADQWQQSIRHQIEYLQRLSTHLGGCVGCGCLSMDQCPLYNPDDIAAAKGKGAVFIEAETPMPSRP